MSGGGERPVGGPRIASAAGEEEPGPETAPLERPDTGDLEALDTGDLVERPFRPTEPVAAAGEPTFGAPRVAATRSASSSRRPQPRDGSRTKSHLGQAKREYPLMRSLLADPEAVPAAEERRGPEPLPHTFIRAPRTAPERAPSSSRPHLDGMLREMTEGLLVGGSSDSTEMRLTLRDEFFRGTELQIVIGSDGVTARFVPPDRDTYRHLSSELHRLRAQLEDRGLRVARLVVEEP